MTRPRQAAAKDLKHLAEITVVLPGLRIARMEKLIPLNTIFQIGKASTAKRPAGELFDDDVEREKMRSHVHQGIQSLKDFASLRTNDEVLDNVGVKQQTGDYALFDYNLSKDSDSAAGGKKKFDESLASAVEGHRGKGDKKS